MESIFIGEELFFYKVVNHDIEKDVANLNLYKNKGDFENNNILKTVDIIEWSDNF